MSRSVFVKRIRAPADSFGPGELDELAQALVGAHSFFLGRKCKQVTPILIRRVLREPIPPRLPPKTNPYDVVTLTRNLVFLKEAVGDETNDVALGDKWRAALQVLLDVQSYTWGSKERLAKLVAIAKTPALLQAIQASVVAIKPPDDAGIEFLAVLALDGSDASADALLPHVHHAMTTGDGLEQLERLKKYAADTPPMRALLARTETLLTERSAASPVVALARSIGIDADPVSFTMWLASRELRHQVPRVQVNFSLDSRSAPSLHVSIGGPDGETSFNEEAMFRDALGFGRPELAALPDYFARAAKKLRVVWSWEEASVYSSLRGRKRDALLNWLRGTLR